MPKRKMGEPEGLSHPEMMDVQNFLVSFKSGSLDREKTISKIIDLLNKRGKMNVNVWEELKDTAENAGFNWVETRDLVFYLQAQYMKSKRN